MNRTGVDDTVVESICQGLFQHERELYAEEELDDAGNIIYQPPPLHESGSMKPEDDKATKTEFVNVVAMKI